jgi:hypothetical protein
MTQQLNAMDLALSVIRERKDAVQQLESAVLDMDSLAAKAMAEPNEEKRNALLRQITNRAGAALHEERSFDAKVAAVQSRVALLQ